MPITIPFDPTTQLPPDPSAPAFETETAPPAGLTSALTATRHAFSGLDDLPVDEPGLPGQETEVAPIEEPPPPVTATPLPIDPAAAGTPPVQGQPSPDVAAMQARMALYEAELAALRQPAPQAQASAATPQAVAIGDDIVNRITDRFQHNFASIQEQRAEESDTDFERRRARSFAETIVAAVYEDLLPTEAVQARFQPTVERVAMTVAQNTVRNHSEAQVLQGQQDTLVSQAVAAAQAAGYDVHLPTDSRHFTSRESRLFWGAATQVDPNLPGQDQIAQTLALMPTKQPVTPTPTPTPAPARPQPMARQGGGPTPVAGAQTQEYEPMTMGGMLSHHRQVSRIGGG